MAKSHDRTLKAPVYQTAGPAIDDVQSSGSLPPPSYLFLPERHGKGPSGTEIKPGSNPRKDQFATLRTFPSLSRYSCLCLLQMKR